MSNIALCGLKKFTTTHLLIIQITLCILWVLLAMSGCSSNGGEDREEEIRIQTTITAQSDTSQMNSIRGNLSLAQIPSTPNSVVLTGLPQHRLVTVYREWPEEKTKDGYFRKYYYDGYESERNPHFMPGIDLIYGYNLINVAHYDLTLEKLDYLFDHPVLIKSLYYPSFVQDSLDKKPITRDYYLISVYDADTNLDTLLNKNDLRRFYYYNAACTEKIQLIPSDYSVVRSQYDSKNDVMYIFARHDADHDGAAEKSEPLHIFWMRLKEPGKAKRLY